ncbi:hypothetical protein [Arthrobacter sp. L77]|uniref:hypothetical protein n=1 Tax=Arthrobacter sp. L77 TaxID=1496689 RepID=UPI000A956955|nr:hypothetical protein [Arthrobacter sp. L77]
MMKIRRNHRKHDQQSASPSPVASTAAGGPVQEPPHAEAHAHRSFFNGLDTAARTFLGPAARSDGGTPVVHRHDAAEEQSDSTLLSMEIHTDSLGHHYAVRKHQTEPPAATQPEEREQPDEPAGPGKH